MRVHACNSPEIAERTFIHWHQGCECVYPASLFSLKRGGSILSQNLFAQNRPCALLKPVNVTENLLSARDGFCVPGQWSFVSSDFDVLLPCVVPFVIAASDLTPARQLYAENELAQALRFVELSRMTKTTDSIEQWNLRLIAAMLQLESRQPNEAWRTLQSALSWRNRLENQAMSADLLPAIEPREWLVMAIVALGVNELDTAERYASEAIGRIQDQPFCCVADLLCDTRADAMAVFATIRLCQQRYQEAEMLLQLARDAYLQAGDMQQLVVGLILLADVEFNSGSLMSAICNVPTA
jgi:tetratricopeptide (TPR) repeat protein